MEKIDYYYYYYAHFSNHQILAQTDLRSNLLSLSLGMSASNSSNSIVPRPFLIGVGGGTASGKTSVCEKIMEKLEITNRRQIKIISMDSFYKSLTDEERSLADIGEYNFDHPDAFDFTKMEETLMTLRRGDPVNIPSYNYQQYCRQDGSQQILQQVDVILVEGILVFYNDAIRELFHMKLFVDSDPDTRLARRVLRYTEERNRDLASILNQYTKFVKPAFEEFCLPVSQSADDIENLEILTRNMFQTKKYADVIIPRGADNIVAIDLIVQHIKDVLLRPANEAQRRSNTGIPRTRHISDISRPH